MRLPHAARVVLAGAAHRVGIKKRAIANAFPLIHLTPANSMQR